MHGALGNRLVGHGTDIACERLEYVSWQKNFPRSVRDRAPGLLVEMMRRKAESAGGQRLYEYNPRTTALSQTCLCGTKEKKPLSQRVHRCDCGITEDRDLFSAYLGLHVRTEADGVDRLDLQTADARAGCVITTSMSRRSPAVVHQHASGKAADIRPRGGPWRASKHGVKPKP